MPDKIKKSQVFEEISLMVAWEPTIRTMMMEKNKTTTVRIAVATVESVCFTPIFARIVVSPAKKADASAMPIAMFFQSPYANDYNPLMTFEGCSTWDCKKKGSGERKQKKPDSALESGLSLGVFHLVILAFIFLMFSRMNKY